MLATGTWPPRRCSSAQLAAHDAGSAASGARRPALPSVRHLCAPHRCLTVANNTDPCCSARLPLVAPRNRFLLAPDHRGLPPRPGCASASAGSPSLSSADVSPDGPPEPQMSIGSFHITAHLSSSSVGFLGGAFPFYLRSLMPTPFLRAASAG